MPGAAGPVDTGGSAGRRAAGTQSTGPPNRVFCPSGQEAPARGMGKWDDIGRETVTGEEAARRDTSAPRAEGSVDSVPVSNVLGLRDQRDTSSVLLI